jgi:hypothetical protein
LHGQAIRDQVAELRALISERISPPRAVDTLMLITRWPALLLAPVKDVDSTLEKLPALLNVPARRLMGVLLK